MKRPPVELECPACRSIVRVADTADDQTEACEDCHRLYDVSYDVDCVDGRERGSFKLVECESPDWRDVQGCLRYHGGL